MGRAPWSTPDLLQSSILWVVLLAVVLEAAHRPLAWPELALPARRTLWGEPVGAALLLHAALFGLGHFLMDFNPLRLGVAIPALAFAFLRHKGGSIVAPVIFHAAANLLMLVVDRSYFP